MTSGSSQNPYPSPRQRDCQELLERASEYLESDLPEEVKEHIRGHLERCGRCRGFVSTLSDTISMLHSLPPHALPTDLKQKLLHISRTQR
ncbi:MAG: zf-HC2 domain-containing protein [Chloroflexi bacterium]|nr:zf-HC2 domain-containing protein [Chloroflexota bacterium]